MADNDSTTHVDNPMTVGGILRETFVQYRSMFRFWMTASACVLIPYLVLESIFDYNSLQSLSQVLNSALDSAANPNATTTVAQSLGSLTMLVAMSLISVLIVSPLLYGTLLHHMTQDKLGRRVVTLDESFSHAAKRLVSVGLTNIIWWLAIAIGAGLVAGLLSALLSVMGRPGVFIGIVLFLALFCLIIWVIVKSSFASSAAFEEGRLVFGAVGRSFDLTKRRFWRTFGYFILLYLIVGIAQVVLALIINYLSGNVILSTVMMGIVTLFLTPLEMIGRANIYIDSRIRTDALS